MALLLLGAAAALAASSAVATEISAARGDWSEIPQISKLGNMRVSEVTAERIAAAAGQGKCAGLSHGSSVRVAVPFLMEFTPAGELKQVVVWKVGCPEMEAVIGGALLQQAKAGEYRPTGENHLGWYRGDFLLDWR